MEHYKLTNLRRCANTPRRDKNSPYEGLANIRDGKIQAVAYTKTNTAIATEDYPYSGQGFVPIKRFEVLLKSLKGELNHDYKPLEDCPTCGSKLHKDEDGNGWHCDGEWKAAFVVQPRFVAEVYKLDKNGRYKIIDEEATAAAEQAEVEATAQRRKDWAACHQHTIDNDLYEALSGKYGAVHTFKVGTSRDWRDHAQDWTVVRWHGGQAILKAKSLDFLLLKAPDTTELAKATLNMTALRALHKGISEQELTFTPECIGMKPWGCHSEGAIDTFKALTDAGLPGSELDLYDYGDDSTVALYWECDGIGTWETPIHPRGGSDPVRVMLQLTRPQLEEVRQRKEVKWKAARVIKLRKAEKTRVNALAKNAKLAKLNVPGVDGIPWTMGIRDLPTGKAVELVVHPKGVTVKGIYYAAYTTETVTASEALERNTSLEDVYNAANFDIQRQIAKEVIVSFAAPKCREIIGKMVDHYHKLDDRQGWDAVDHFHNRIARRKTTVFRIFGIYTHKHTSPRNFIEKAAIDDLSLRKALEVVAAVEYWRVEVELC